MNLLAPAARLVFSWNHDELMREGARAWPPPRRGPGAARHARTAAPAGQERAMGRRGRRADNTAPVCLVTMSLMPGQTAAATATRIHADERRRVSRMLMRKPVCR
jgi:hypothetical protein